jgi:hypothetical protein
VKFSQQHVTNERFLLNLKCCNFVTSHKLLNSVERIMFLDFVHRLTFLKKHKCFGNWTFPSSGKIKAVPTLLCPLERAGLNHYIQTYKHLRSEPVSETSCFLRNITRWTKSKNTILSSAIHHHQKRLELILNSGCTNTITACYVLQSCKK